MTAQTMDRTSTARASVELSEQGGSVSMDGTFHALRATTTTTTREAPAAGPRTESDHS